MTQSTKTRSDISLGASLGYPCTPEGAVDLLIDHDEIEYNANVNQFGYIR